MNKCWKGKGRNLKNHKKDQNKKKENMIWKNKEICKKCMRKH
jgi:hypothetical protein